MIILMKQGTHRITGLPLVAVLVPVPVELGVVPVAPLAVHISQRAGVGPRVQVWPLSHFFSNCFLLIFNLQVGQNNEPPSGRILFSFV